MTGNYPYSPTYRDELAMVRHFVHVLETGLAGRSELRRVNINPLDWCHLGVLAPYKASPVLAEAQDVQADTEEALADEVEANATESAGMQKGATSTDTAGEGSGDTAKGAAEPVDGSTQNADAVEDFDARRRSPSSLGFEILVQPEGDIELLVNASFCIFTKHLPTRAEQTAASGAGAPIAEVAQRWPVTVKGIRMTLTSSARDTSDGGTIQAAVDARLREAFDRPDAGRCMEKGARPDVREAALADDAQFESFLTQVRRLPVDSWRIDVRLELRSWRLQDGRVRIGCYLRNDTPATGIGVKDAFRIVGDAMLSAKVSGGCLCPIEILPVPVDYQYDRRVWAVGHNTSVEVSEDRREVRTHALAYYEQRRVVTKDVPPATFEDVAANTFSTLETIYRAMEAYVTDWQARIIDANVLGLQPVALDECKNDYRDFRAEIDRFASGIAALKEDEKLLIAFQAMNRIFGKLAKDYAAWRLFQLVFIVTQLPALAIREELSKGQFPDGVIRDWTDVLDWGDVLWFRTGGGKTEAYLGLTCCAILYDRLRGKNQGVTAWLRFPLRMLSVQQLQRAMRVVWETENERKALLGNKSVASDPVRLGYFVGSTSTPNSLSPEVMERYASKEALENLRVVPDCPACGGKGTVYVSSDTKAVRFRHVCSGEGGCGAELPLDISDDEVYRHLPALLVGTIDKMASVGQQKKYGLLWGGARWRCPEHGYSFGQWCTVFGCKVDKKRRSAVSPYDPSPALHIQDELHLLQEELGAFAGHYETLVRFCERTARSRPSKVVAATATIEGFEHQMHHVYGVKGARRFPGRGYDRMDTFYAQPDKTSDGAEKAARVFVAFRPTQMHHSDAAAYCTELLQSEIHRLITNPHLGLAILSDAKSESDVLSVMHFYTTSLNYVGSLASGSRVKDALEGVAESSRPGSRALKVEYRNSRSSGAEVAELVHMVENPPDWAEPTFLDAAVATNMISHGVDLERINLMVMDGMPEATAEYIQASSRSGRRHVGLVVVVLPSFSLRAASVYQRFLEFHEHLDRMVAPVPVNRFAKFAARRTLPGITVGLLYGRYAVELGADSLNKRHEAAKLLQQRGFQAFLVQVERAYALGEGIYDAGLEAGLKDTLSEQLERVLLSIENSHADSVRDAVRPSPMTSLRDVEAGVPFYPESTLDHHLLYFIRDTKE